jgi:hypothetical protein
VSATATATTTTTASASRRAPKRKKNAQKRRLEREKSQKKLEILVETLKPIPFVPSKTLDFQSHEKLLRRLGLWDFVHIEFDKNLRADLLAQLIANYSPQKRCSYVNSARVNVNRADLARALKLPLPAKKNVVLLDEESEAEVGGSVAESVGFVEDFVSNWVLLHEDTWMMPNEVLNWTKVIKEGHFEKVDWASLIWFMVEKELVQAQKLTNCYYASHLQYLIRWKHDQLLKEESNVQEVEVEEVEVKEEEEEDEEDLDGSGDVKMGEVEEFRGRELEENSIELSLGQDNVERREQKVESVEEKVESVEEKVESVEEKVERVEEKVERVEEKVEVDDVDVNVEKERGGNGDIMDFEECREEYKEEEGGGQWLFDRKSNLGDMAESFLRPCSVGEVKGLDCGEEKREEVEEGEEEGEEEGQEEEGEEEEEEDGGQEVCGFHLSPKCNTLEGLASGSLIQEMEGAQMPFSTELELRDHSAGGFLTSRDDSRMISGGSSLFCNNNKRGIGHENDNIHNSLNEGNKRLRSDGPWDGKVADFDMCMDQVQHWVGKARMMYAAKEQACGDATVNQQILLNEVQQRDSLIEHLRAAKFEDQQKRQVELYRLDREVYMMGHLLDGYRKALKEVHGAFAEYRARCPQPEEPLYKDVPQSGGLVLSSMELEKQRLKQEEEDRMNRLVIEKKVKVFEGGWKSKFEAHLEGVDLLGNRLLNVENEVKLLKESLATRKVSEISDGTPIE